MDPKLIKANIALFNGSRSEARRLLAEYDAENPRPADDTLPMLMWLNAQAQDDRSERMTGLQALVDKAGKTDPYAVMASDYLSLEAKYGDAITRAPVESEAAAAPKGRRLPRVLGVELWKAGAFAVLGLVIGLLVISVLPRPPAGFVSATMTPVEPSAADFTPPPDRSVRIAPEDHQAEFDRGILEVSAFEDASERVANLDGALLTPVQGTRFYALKVRFECRGGGVCNEPPEAQVLLQAADGSIVPVVEGAGLLGEALLQPIGSGSSTNGWFVFELPNGSAANALVLVPPAPNGQDPQPIAIPLTEASALPPEITAETTPQ